MKSLREKLKNQSISIVDLAEKFQVTRPTIYSWIKLFDNLKFSELPNNVLVYFNSFSNSNCQNKNNSILDVIDDYSLKFYGPNDFMFGHVLKLCCDHFVKIKNYFVTADISGGVSVINYFWLKKIINYENWKDILKPDSKIFDVIVWAKKELEKYKPHEIAESMLKNFIYLFEGNKKSVHSKEFYIQEIFSKPTLYNKLFPLIQEKYKSLIFYYFSKDYPSIVNYYKKNHNDFLKYMLDSKQFTLDNCSTVADFASITIKRSICVDQTKYALSDFLSKHSKFSDFTKGNYIQIIYYVENLQKIAEEIGARFLPNGLEINEFKKMAEKAIIDFGEEFSGNVDITELRNFLLNRDINIASKFSSLTLVERNGTFVDSVSTYEPKSVFSMFSNVIGMKTDDYYTQERIDFYKITTSLECYCIDFILKNDLVNDFASYLSSCSETIIKNLKIKDDTLNDEVVGAVNLLLNSQFIKNEKFQKAYYYSICLNTISLIEKILRYVYMTYVKNDTATNASILVYLNIRSKNDFDKTMKDFDYHLYKFLGYYLCKNENDVGKDLRNKFMHREKDVYKLASYNLALVLYSLLLHLLTYVMRKSLVENKTQK